MGPVLIAHSLRRDGFQWLFHRTQLPFCAFVSLEHFIFVCMSKWSLMGFSRLYLLMKYAHMVWIHLNRGSFMLHMRADESAPPTCPHGPSIPTKCFNGLLVKLVSLGEMMAVWWAALLLLVSYKRPGTRAHRVDEVYRSSVSCSIIHKKLSGSALFTGAHQSNYAEKHEE